MSSNSSMRDEREYDSDKQNPNPEIELESLLRFFILKKCNTL